MMTWLYSVLLFMYEQQNLLSIDVQLCEFIRLLSSVAYKGLLSKH